MSLQLAPAIPAASPARRPLTARIVKALVRRRVKVTALLFTAVVIFDMLVIGGRPRDVLKLSDPFVGFSEVLILFGLTLRSWAAGTLRKTRELATTGPYAWIRNPLYAGSFLMMVGFCTLVRDPVSLWCVIGPLAWLYWQAIKSEEQHLARIFARQWPLYSSAVPRFIPRRLIPPTAADWSLAQWLRNAEHQAWIGSAVALAGIKVWELWA